MLVIEITAGIVLASVILDNSDIIPPIAVLYSRILEEPVGDLTNHMDDVVSRASAGRRK
jgi:hypothetical protein